MKIYALIISSAVYEVIQPAPPYDTEVEGWTEDMPSRIGQERPIEERYPPELVSQMVDITDLDPMPESGWTYDGSVFSAPIEYVPTPAEILAANTLVRDALLSTATLAIAPLQDAVDLEEATDDETAKLKKWKQYRVAVNRIDLTLATPSWPVATV